MTGSIWGGEGAPVKTHGWVLPARDGGKAGAIAWNGLVYPAASVGTAADLRADVSAIIEEQLAVRAEPNRAHVRRHRALQLPCPVDREPDVAYMFRIVDPMYLDELRAKLAGGDLRDDRPVPPARAGRRYARRGVRGLTMKPTPKNWTRVAPALYYRDAAKAIGWLCEAFGFQVRLKVEGEGGKIAHSELTYGDDGLIMVGEETSPERPEAVHRRSPASIGGANTQGIMLYVDDAIAHCEQARRAGAKILSEPSVTDYGEEYWMDRGYECADLEGHHWWFCERLRDPKV
ncbi:MAG TPA: VOC family protein [Kofleriaceae bacterium]|nr:VOC family protein [Kofleriaceae bacterium]